MEPKAQTSHTQAIRRRTRTQRPWCPHSVSTSALLIGGRLWLDYAIGRAPGAYLEVAEEPLVRQLKWVGEREKEMKWLSRGREGSEE